jgi:hypothetical protein
MDTGVAQQDPCNNPKPHDSHVTTRAVSLQWHERMCESTPMKANTLQAYCKASCSSVQCWLLSQDVATLHVKSMRSSKHMYSRSKSKPRPKQLCQAAQKGWEDHNNSGRQTKTFLQAHVIPEAQVCRSRCPVIQSDWPAPQLQVMHCLQRCLYWPGKISHTRKRPQK